VCTLQNPPQSLSAITEIGNVSTDNPCPIADMSNEPVETVKILVDKNLRSRDNRTMKVQTSDQGLKRYFCTYCKKFCTKLPRHFETVHKDEEDVKAFLASNGMSFICFTFNLLFFQ